MYDIQTSHPDQQNPNAAAEAVRNVRQDAEDFRNSPNGSAPFRTASNTSEEKLNDGETRARATVHTIPVREAARRFEASGVARTERSIVNWCQPNPQGVARLDAYFDPNERRWLISPESLERAIAEERAKVARSDTSPIRPEPEANPETTVRASGDPEETKTSRDAEAAELQELTCNGARRTVEVESLRFVEERDRMSRCGRGSVSGF